MESPEEMETTPVSLSEDSDINNKLEPEDTLISLLWSFILASSTTILEPPSTPACRLIFPPSEVCTKTFPDTPVLEVPPCKTKSPANFPVPPTISIDPPFPVDEAPAISLTSAPSKTPYPPIIEISPATLSALSPERIDTEPVDEAEEEPVEMDTSPLESTDDFKELN